MNAASPLSRFAEAVVAADDEAWYAPFLEQLQPHLSADSQVALFVAEGPTFRCVAANDGCPTLSLAVGENQRPSAPYGTLHALPCATGGWLWLDGGTVGDETLPGWLAVAGLRLACQQQQQESVRQSSARDHFFSMVNHDLKSPLSSIKAMADLLVRKIERGTLKPESEVGRADLLERLRFLSQRSKAMAELIDEIGDLATIERGRLQLHRQKEDLGSLLRSAVEGLQGAAERPLQVTGDDVPTPIHADGRRIGQLLHILLDNALAYSDEGSPIRLRLSRTRQHAQLQIEDQGFGIEPERQRRLFHEYGRAVQDHPSGLGVGLYVAAALAQAHDGFLTLQSSPGKGTTVTLTLPLHP